MTGKVQAHYYTGVFHSQFVTAKPDDKKSWKMAEIRLEQRFVLKVEREITLEEFEAARSGRVSGASTAWQSRSHSGYRHEAEALQPHVLLSDNHDLELEFSDGSSSREICTELYVEFGESALPDAIRTQDFTAFKDGNHHGRITGRGYVRIPVLTIPEKELQRQAIFARELRRRRGCMTPFIPGGGIGFSGPFRTGLFGGAGGFSRGGCGRTGCGLLSLLMLLGTLMSLWKGCQKAGMTDDGRRVIHDTVYVDAQSKQDVIKQFLDTTTIFKTESVELPNVQFYTNSARLLPYSITSIQQLADYLNAHPYIHAVIEGHTDNTGDPQANLDLSRQRAESVRQLLVSLGVDQGRVEARGYGMNRPRATNGTVEGRALNRRVEVRLINTEKTETRSTEVTDGN
ncbi:MAG: hypothetical protein RL213_1936 [Bacteroidota bacterium]|jgi:outer membrane protein OmpA-like peptidoglycan-associated protein